MRSLCTSGAVGRGRPGADPASWAFCWGGAAGAAAKASAGALGQAASVAGPGGGGARFRGARATGAGRKRLLRALEVVEGSGVRAGTEPFGSSRLFTRAINS